MHIYQFIKYNNQSSPEHLIKYSGTGANICFDFEDSIYDWINPHNSQKLKSQAREIFNKIYQILNDLNIKIKTGVRINSSNDSENEKDLESLNGKIIKTVWLPKVEKPEDIFKTYERLKHYNVKYEELIPIIETKTALQNLALILKETNNLYPKIAFGHSDYNFSINSLPFFHQYNIEYWKWVKRIIGEISPYKKTFINSPFLYLNDSAFFSKILSHLYHLLGDDFGQVTLTTLQSEICNSFDKDFAGFNNLIDNRNDLNVPDGYTINVINEFERFSTSGGFSLKQNDYILLPPQEYISTKKYLKEKKKENFKLVFVGGCFPVQYNILFEDLFHQKLKKLLQDINIELNIKLIRYERFKNCLKKIMDYCDKHKPDLLIFHIRPEPFFRLLKFYYKYSDKNGNIKRSFNIPFLNLLKPEEYDVYDIAREFEGYSDNFNRKSNALKIDINYSLGCVIGNLHYSVNKYLKLTDEITDYCKEKEFELLVLGPLISSCSLMETVFSNYLRKKVENFCYNNMRFISGIPVNKQKIVCFDKNGKFASQEYHDFISVKLFDTIKSITDS